MLLQEVEELLLVVGREGGVGMDLVSLELENVVVDKVLGQSGGVDGMGAVDLAEAV